MQLINENPRLIALAYGEESPLQNHGGMEVAVDHERREFYVHEIMLWTYGTDSVIAACKKYPQHVKNIPSYWANR